MFTYNEMHFITFGKFSWKLLFTTKSHQVWKLNDIKSMDAFAFYIFIAGSFHLANHTNYVFFKVFVCCCFFLGQKDQSFECKT